MFLSSGPLSLLEEAEEETLRSGLGKVARDSWFSPYGLQRRRLRPGEGR